MTHVSRADKQKTRNKEVISKLQSGEGSERVDVIEPSDVRKGVEGGGSAKRTSCIKPGYFSEQLFGLN